MDTVPDASRKRKQPQPEEAKRQVRAKPSPAGPACTLCRVKLRITNAFSCKCARVFCGRHRYADEHQCSYDYQLENRLKLAKENPRILSSRPVND